MAAAIDAMDQLGFPKKLVRAKMNYLLKEYGGHDGYPFIEADAYRVLIEALLAGVEEESNQGETSMTGDSPEGERVGDHMLLAGAGPSGGSIGSGGFETPNTELQTDRAEEDGNRWTSCQDERMVEATDNTGGSPVGDMHLLEPPVCSPPVVIASSPASQSIPTQKRKPCYGWISDDEEADLVTLMAAGTPTRTPSSAGLMESSSNGTVKQAKRKTRWDIRPEDM